SQKTEDRMTEVRLHKRIEYSSFLLSSVSCLLSCQGIHSTEIRCKINSTDEALSVIIGRMRSTISGLIALAKRLVFILPVVWAVVTLVFLLIHIVPGDPVRNALGDNATAEQVRELKQRLGLDLPLYKQYVNYWRGVLSGDLGVSLINPSD